jgi:RIO kinase 1
LIPDDVDYAESELGRLKSGKEAEVFLVERSYETRSCLLVHKRYRPRLVSHKGELTELGFEGSSRFANDAAYRAGRVFANSRDRRAAQRMSTYGRTIVNAQWTGHELDMLREAWDAGVRVPYPVGARGDGLLMQYLGDLHGAAPRLAQTRLSSAELAAARTQVVENLRRLVGAGFVHADLSAYNVLWWEGEAWFIDFPQAVDVTVNDRAFDFLYRDLTNVFSWFARRGEVIDVDAFFAELVAAAHADPA